MRSNLIKLVTPIFRNVFDAPSLEVSESLSAADVEGWDSFAHINLIVALEEAFKVSFTTTELGQMACVGDLITLLQAKGVKP
ncbi:MAG: acyl carrier protein [Prosthecobacter sp.]|uniref:acyl carrier protein n=1 Tax=Prosthecobacter sp. TaxID=1965333 RepID=UPI0038FE69D9